MTDISWNEKDLGPVDAYALAVAGGYTGTKEQWIEEIANASTNASNTEAYAKGTRGGQPVTSDDPAYQNNAEYYNGLAQTAKTAAQEAAGTASAAYNVNLLAPNYGDLTFPVKAGQHCIHSGGYYVAKQDIDTSEDWTAAHWTQKDIGNELSDVKSAFDDTTKNLSDNVFQQNSIQPFSTVSGRKLKDTGVYETNSDYKLLTYSVFPGDILLISSDDHFQFQSGTTIPTVPPNQNLVGTTKKNGVFVVSVPDTALYLIVSTKVSGSSASVKIVSGDSEIIKERLIPFRKNLFDKTARTEGLLKSDGTTETNASYVTTDYIKCYAGQVFTISPSVRSLCGYDNAKTFRNGSFDNSAAVNTGSTLTYTTPYDGYIRFSLPKASTDTAQIEWGNSATAYVDYGVIKLSDNVQLNALNNVIIDEAQLNSYVKDAIREYSNLIDKTATTNGYIGSSNGNITESSSYETTDFIYVKAGVAVTFAPRIRAILAYDTSKNPITSTFNNTTVNNDTPQTFTPTVTGYVRATMMVSDKATWQCVVGTTVGTPEPFGKYISPDVAIPGNDILSGKKWVVCGDSFTNGTDTGTLESGDYEGEKIVYPYIIGNRTHINVIKFFKNGQTLAFPAEPGTFVNSLTCPSESYYYQNIPADADYITIYLGINDSHHSPGSSGGDGEDNTGEIPLGTITDNTTATYYGAWNVVLTWLLTNRPFAHIGIIASNGCDNDDYRLAQIAIAQKYGIPYLDLNGDDRCRAMIRSTNPNIPAAVKAIIRDAQAVNYPTDSHPNNNAHRLQSTFIETWLRTL